MKLEPHSSQQTKRHGLPPLRLALALILALAGPHWPMAMAQKPAATASAGITAIRIERNCFGCASGSVLALYRDGRAAYTTTGNARSGTADKTSAGTIAPDEFERLARLAVSSDFFSLNESYEDTQTRDGAWVTTIIEREGREKQVFRREDAGPPALAALEAAIDATKARIRFNP